MFDYLRSTYQRWFAPDVPADAKVKGLTQALGYVDPSRLVMKWQVAPYNPSWLVTRKSMFIYDQMRRDEQIKAALKFKKDSVLAAAWEVVSPGDKDEDWEVTRFVRDNFKAVEGGWNQFLLNMLSALDFGYAVAERIYAERDAGEWKGKMCLQKLSALRPHFLDFRVDPFGVLEGVIQRNVMGGMSGGLTGTPLPPAKLVIHTYNYEFGNYYGVSDLESAYRPWWTKDNTYKWLAITLERFGMPPLFALYDSASYSTGDLTELKKVLKGIQNATLGIIPRATKDALELWSQELGGASTQTFLLALDRFDHHISRALLVPDLVGMGGSSGGGGSEQERGSLARSRQHAESFMKVVQQLQINLASNVVNAQVIPQLCDLNFPGLDAYPEFRWLPITDEKFIEIISTWAELVGGGVVGRIEDDETHIRKALGFPENEDPKLQPLPSEQKKGEGAAKPGEKPVLKKLLVEKDDDDAEELTQEELEYVAQQGGRWVTVRGHRVFIKDKPQLNERIERALATHKPSTLAKQGYAVEQELRVAQVLGADVLDNNEPMDVVGEVGGRRYGVEVKTFVDNTNDKVTMHPDSLERKLKWGRKERAALHTVVVDGRKETGNATLYSGHSMWYRRGVGSFRLQNMVPVRDAVHLRALVSGEVKFEDELAEVHGQL